jgi:Mrp family chromosome partitioning ATPase/LPS O-antigen subunit length determinant protein (WzzB/FepE family)
VATLRDYLQVVRRRKWVILAAILLVPAAALAFSLLQQKRYEGSAQVLLSQQDLGSVLTRTQVNMSSADPADRQTQTQQQLARVPNVAGRAIRRLHINMTTAEFLAATSVLPGTNSDTLSFTATDRDPELASRMASAYAHAYVAYRLQVETAPIEAARRGLDGRLQSAKKGSALYNGLVEKEQTLQELEALKTSDATVVQSGTAAVQTAPKTARNVTLGIILGLFLGIGLAFLRETLDTRIRSAESIADQLGLPLLARLPEPPKKLREMNHLAMVDDPTGLQAEAFRMFRTNVEFASLGRDIQTIMVTSALEREGKSTTMANLAVALARAGQRVVLVDLDLRRPFVDKFFDLAGRAGVTNIAVGHVTVEEALVPMELPPIEGRNGSAGSALTASGQVKILANGGGGRRSDSVGSLSVLPTGPIPPDPGEFVGTAQLTAILEQLRRLADVVLIDAPPLFHVGDGLTLSAKVDAVIVVTRMEVVRRPMLSELRRLLETMPANKLGFVVTGAESEETFGYGYGGYSYYRGYESAPPQEEGVPA